MWVISMAAMVLQSAGPVQPVPQIMVCAPL